MTWRTVQARCHRSAASRSTAQKIAPLRFPDNQCETNERNTDAREKERGRKHRGAVAMGTNNSRRDRARRTWTEAGCWKKLGNGATPPFAFGQGGERNKLGERRSDFQLGMLPAFSSTPRRGAGAPLTRHGKEETCTQPQKRTFANCILSNVAR